MDSYLEIVDRVLSKGDLKKNRTGVSAYTVVGAEFVHDMSQGFPLITTKKMASKSIRVELEGFINGETSKQWFKDRECNIWNDWCNPSRVPYGTDAFSQKQMADENDLGPIYGWQWRHWGAEYIDERSDYSNKGIDQLARVVDTLKKNPSDRRMIVSAWNPKDLPLMALPPCHYSFQVTVINEKLNLIWNQRSVDTMLGLPFNIASYGLLLHLLAKESGYTEGTLVGHLGDVHIYKNHVLGAREQLSRTPNKLPNAVTEPFNSIFDWKHNHTYFENYNPHSKIEFQIAV